MDLTGLDWIQSPSGVLQSLQSCQTLCDPIDGSPPGSEYRDSGQEDIAGTQEGRFVGQGSLEEQNPQSYRVRWKDLG